MKILFIRPNIGRLAEGAYVNEGLMEPLELAVLAALTPGEHECGIHDDRIEPVSYDEPADLVAITVETYTARRSYEIALGFRERGVRVILGGFHASLAPDECLMHADSVFIGDAEQLWEQVVSDAANGRLRSIYRSEAGNPQAGGVLPRRGLYRDNDYLPITLMQFGRGCKFACSFCAINAFFHGNHTVRPTPEVLEELSGSENRTIFFVDDNFLSDHDAAKSFLRELVGKRIRWVSQGSIDMTTDSELMELMEASGCMGHVIGFESLNPANLKSVKKAPNLIGPGWDRYGRACEVLRKHHLQTWAAFTLGYDHDTVDSINEVADFAIANKFCVAAFNILMPYPGTALYQKLQEENRLLYGGRWWLDPDYRFNHAAFKPANMTPDELTRACWECKDRWSKPGTIFRRVWDFKTHLSSPVRLALFLAFNRIVAREIRRKQSMFFGLRHDSLKSIPGAGA